MDVDFVGAIGSYPTNLPRLKSMLSPICWCVRSVTSRPSPTLGAKTPAFSQFRCSSLEVKSGMVDAAAGQKSSMI